MKQNWIVDQFRNDGGGATGMTVMGCAAMTVMGYSAMTVLTILYF